MIGKIILITLASMTGIVLLCLAVIWLEKKFPGKRFDEMQISSRLKGTRAAFWIGMLYYLVTVPILIGQVDGEKTIEPYLLVTIGFLMQMMILYTYCLLTHSNLPLGDNPLVAIGSYAFIGLTQLLIFRDDVADYQFHNIPLALTLVGRSSILWFHLVFAICFFYIALLNVIQLIRSWKE